MSENLYNVEYNVENLSFDLIERLIAYPKSQ